MYDETVNKVPCRAEWGATLTVPSQEVFINSIWNRETDLLWVLLIKGFVTQIRIYIIVGRVTEVRSRNGSRMFIENFLADLPETLPPW